jgi:hypothetical protein
VQGFDNMDEMFSAMAAAEDAANFTLTPGQIALRDDVESTRHWAQAIPDYDMVIYGATPPIAEIEAREPGFDVADNRERGYLTGVAFSVDTPTGESGDTHVSQVIPISAETFALAKSLDWPTWSMLREREQRDLATRLAGHEADARCRV